MSGLSLAVEKEATEEVCLHYLGRRRDARFVLYWQSAYALDRDRLTCLEEAAKLGRARTSSEPRVSDGLDSTIRWFRASCDQEYMRFARCVCLDPLDLFCQRMDHLCEVASSFLGFPATVVPNATAYLSVSPRPEIIASTTENTIRLAAPEQLGAPFLIGAIVHEWLHVLEGVSDRFRQVISSLHADASTASLVREVITMALEAHLTGVVFGSEWRNCVCGRWVEKENALRGLRRPNTLDTFRANRVFLIFSLARFTLDYLVRRGGTVDEDLAERTVGELDRILEASLEV